jgi:hypothetical protein
MASVDQLYSCLISMENQFLYLAAAICFLLPVTARFGVHFICTELIHVCTVYSILVCSFMV